LIAGDALVGILLAVLAWRGISLRFAEGWMGGFSAWGSLIIFGLLAAELRRSAGG